MARDRGKMRAAAVLAACAGLAVLDPSLALAAGLGVAGIRRATGAIGGRAARLDRRGAALEALGGLSLGRSGALCAVFQPDGTTGARSRDTEAAQVRAVLRQIRGTLRPGDLALPLGRGRVAAISSRSSLGTETAALICRCQAAADRVGPTLSAGVAAAPAGFCPVELLEAAEAALDRARLNGPRQIEMVAAGARRKTAGPTVFVPRLDLRTGEIAALSVIPDPSAEKVSLPGLESGLELLVRLDEAGLAVPLLSVPLDPADIARPGLAVRIAFALDRAEIEPGRLELRLPAPDAARAALELAESGCSLAAGTGVPERVGIDTVLIDARLAPGLAHAPRARTRAKRLIAAARARRLAAVARDVSSIEEVNFLSGLGCDLIEGPVVSRPRGATDTLEWLRARGPVATARIA